MAKQQADRPPTGLDLVVDSQTLAILLHGVFVDDPTTGLLLLRDWGRNDPASFREWLAQMTRLVRLWEQIREIVPVDNDELPF